MVGVLNYVCIFVQEITIKPNKMIATTDTTQTLKFNERVIVTEINEKGLIIARYGRIMASGKNKGQTRFSENYRFGTLESRQKWVNEKIEFCKKWVEADKKEAEFKEAAKANYKMPYSVGDILYSSWGYEQTNVDFYQVIEVKGKSVILHEIAGEMISQSAGDQGRVKPLKDQFTDKATFLKQVRQTAFNGQISYHITLTSYANLYLYTNGEKGQYCSWGY